jgi:hypothetical protein
MAWMIVSHARAPRIPVIFLSRRQDALYVKDETGLLNEPEHNKRQWSSSDDDRNRFASGVSGCFTHKS